MNTHTLTLPEELMVLGINPGRAKGLVLRHHLHYGMAGALLAELEWRGRLAENRGKVVALAGPATGDPLFDAGLALLRAGKPVRTRRWISRHAGTVSASCAERLVQRGALRIESRRILGLFPSRSYHLTDLDLARHVLVDFQGAAKLGFPDPRSRTLAALAGAIDLSRRIVPDTYNKKELRRSIRALTRDTWSAHAVRRIIEAESSDGGG